VPTPLPELEDLLARARFGTLARRLKVWALTKRIPWFHLFLEAVRGFLPSALVGVPEHKRPAPWIDPKFAKQNRLAFQGYETRLPLFGPPPSFQENIWALEALRRQLGCDPLPAEPLHEKRYPYLDRDLVEFMYSIPREQLVRPGQRRSLMRRALVGIVPSELLNRKRKAYVSRGPMSQIAADLHGFLEFSQRMVSGSLEVLDTSRFGDALRAVGRAQDIPIVLVMRTLALEMWLRHVETWSSSHSSSLVKVDVALRGLPRERQTSQSSRNEFSLS
jgi:asparagine synthase (glutamine-hydrolysing)